jgi:hypothetical protein
VCSRSVSCCICACSRCTSAVSACEAQQQHRGGVLAAAPPRATSLRCRPTHALLSSAHPPLTRMAGSEELLAAPPIGCPAAPDTSACWCHSWLSLGSSAVLSSKAVGSICVRE